jgi:glycosyltransferase involved in cell wall biosynthesis
MIRPCRVLFIQTHPVQYYAPWFRHIALHCPGIDLAVLYATQPTPEQQGVGFGRAFAWDAPLLDGYRYEFLRAPRPRDDFGSSKFWGVDAPQVSAAIRRHRPDVAVIFGWNSSTLVRAIVTCHGLGIPVLYRGDNNMVNAPDGWRRRAWQAKMRFLLRHGFQGYLGVGRLAEYFLLSFGMPRGRIFSSPHCVDNEFFARAAAPHQLPAARTSFRRLFGFAPDDFVVLFAGKLEAIKRPGDAVSAVAKLGPKAGLLVVGSGALEAELRRRAVEQGVRAAFLGFLNQSEIVRAYAASDCLVLPSQSETWGLVVNEALAVGLPCVVNERVGCFPDLIVPNETGEVYSMGDVAALEAALGRVRRRIEEGWDWKPACRARAARYSFAAATKGLVEACRTVVRRPEPAAPPRVIACCGGMAFVGGLELQTFEVLAALRRRGAAVHCVVNEWATEDRPNEPHPIGAMAEKIGASWSTGRYRETLTRRTHHPARLLLMVWDVACTSAGLLRDAMRFRPTFVLAPDFGAVLRNAPALLALRALGVRVILRLGNAPDRGRFYTFLWQRVLPRFVDCFVANSEFGATRLRESGVQKKRIRIVRNSIVERTPTPGLDADVVELVKSRRTILYVGQIAPFKGTQLAVDAAIDLLAEGRDVQALFVGRYPDWPAEYVAFFEQLKQKVKQVGAGSRIVFIGERSNVLDIMKHAYILVAPILQEETFGNVVLEAASVGLPAVVFPRGGLPELVEHLKTGYLCSDSDASALREGLKYFLDDPAARDRMSAAASAWFARPDCEYGRPMYEEGWRQVFGAPQLPV